MLDPVEPESEEPTELAPVEETNPELNQGKPWCISPKFLDFYFNSLLYVKYDCALNYRCWTVVTLRLHSHIILVTLVFVSH
jgi:hypothetical protein